MKLVTKEASEPCILDDPRPKDRVTWQRIRVAVEHEACHRDWGCALYTLHRSGRINNEQREAGDKYGMLVRDFRKLWDDPMGKIEVYRGFGRTDDREEREPEKRSRATRDVEIALGHVVADSLVEESEFTTRRAKRLGERYQEAREIAGQARSVLEAMLLDDVWPVCERGHVEIGHALTRLSHFFSTGTKRKHRK
jgi:hypothetical protein